MKIFLAMLLSIFSSACLASTCMLTEGYSYTSTPDAFGRVYVDCNVGNADSRAVKTAKDTPNNREVATVLNAMLDKGYKVAGQSGEGINFTITLVK